jgi:hypothetical protein
VFDLVAPRLDQLALRALAEPADLRGRACASLALLGAPIWPTWLSPTRRLAISAFTLIGTCGEPFGR